MAFSRFESRSSSWALPPAQLHRPSRWATQPAAAYTLAGHPELSCRVFGINAPELATDAGKAALAYAEQICPPGTMVTVVSHSWDKYGGRWDGTITLPDGSDFATRMLAAGQAVVMT